MRPLFAIQILTLAFFSIFQITFAQDGSERKAQEYIENKNYEDALEEYLILIEDKAKDAQLNYLIGVCYLNTYIDKKKAVVYLESAMEYGYYDNNLNYLLGMAYHTAGKYDEAIRMFTEFKKGGGGSAAEGVVVDKQIEYAENAKELLKFPVDVTFENLGSNINSAFPEYFPFVPLDESFIVYNGRRDDGSLLRSDGSYYSNVYIASVVDGKYERGFPVGGAVNSEDGNEEVCGLSSDGNLMVIYHDNWDGFGDLFLSARVGGSFQEPQLFDKSINSSFHEIAASITANSETLYFASNRKGGYGGTDLYIVKKLPTGSWGVPTNLGPSINTRFDEDFPNISPDGNTLYFSSKGHTSMGGYDIFKANWISKKKKFVNAINLGHPINTTWDDMNFRISENGKYGYIAAVRPEGYGDYDIYRVNFNSIEPRYTVLKGVISSSDTAQNPIDVMITVTNNKTGDIYGDYLPNPNSMRYVIILPPGEYMLAMDAAGHAPITEKLNIYDKASFVAEIKKNITLKAN